MQALNQVLVVAYIYPASGIPVPKWVIRTQLPQQLDGLEGQYKNQVPIMQVQPVTIFQYSATFKACIILLLVEILSRYEELTR